MSKSQAGFLKAPNLSLRDVAATLFRRKWLIAATFFTAVTATAVFAWLTPDKYESRMKLLVKNMRADAPVTAGNEKVPDQNEVSESQIASQIELLKSRDLLEEVVKQTNLAKPEAPGAEVSGKDIEKAVLRLEKDLQITPVKKASIIEVSYSSNLPETSASVLSKLAELFLEKHLKLHRPPGTSEFFEAQAQEHERELRLAENRFSDFQQRKNVISIGQQKELTVSKLAEANSRLKDLEGAISETDKRIASLEKQLEGMDRRVTTQSRVLPNQFSVERLNTLLIELKNRRIQLLAKFQPTERVVQEVDEQIKLTTEALEKAKQTNLVEQSSDLNPLRQTLETELARARVDQSGRMALRKNLLGQIQQYQAKLTSLEGATVVHDDLARQIKQAEENYQLYAKKEEESRIADALDEKKITNITVAEAPIAPLTPNRNNRILALVLGLSSGLLLAFGGAFVSELLRETFHTPRELQAFTDLPVLATIPLQKPGQSDLRFEPVAEPVDEMEFVFGKDILDESIIRDFHKSRVRVEFQED